MWHLIFPKPTQFWTGWSNSHSLLYVPDLKTITTAPSRSSNTHQTCYISKKGWHAQNNLSLDFRAQQKWTADCFYLFWLRNACLLFYKLDLQLMYIEHLNFSKRRGHDQNNIRKAFLCSKMRGYYIPVAFPFKLPPVIIWMDGGLQCWMQPVIMKNTWIHRLILLYIYDWRSTTKRERGNDTKKAQRKY